MYKWVAIFSLLGFSAAALALDEDYPYAGIHPIAVGSAVLVNPSASFGFEGGGALLYAPDGAHDFFLGPRMSFLYAPSPGRFDWNVGIEGVLWFVNAVGVGVGADYIPASSIGGVGGMSVDTHFRYGPYLGLRMSHYQDNGALGVRAQIFYDTHYQVGLGLGLTLEWSGVPQIGT
jgi:hypothetical protein